MKMNCYVFILALLLELLWPSARAQSVAGASATVTFIEVVPTAAEAARQFAVSYVDAARRAPDCVRIEALARIGVPGHFAILEQWQSPVARSDYSSSDASAHFRSQLMPLRSAAYDERPHVPLLVHSESVQANDALMVLTHIDIIPSMLEVALPKVKEFVELGRQAPGNIGFDLLVQASRQNHLTIVEKWETSSAREDWISTASTRHFREELTPLSGSLYDERLYKILR